jgi:hypothetical protein
LPYRRRISCVIALFSAIESGILFGLSPVDPAQAGSSTPVASRKDVVEDRIR